MYVQSFPYETNSQIKVIQDKKTERIQQDVLLEMRTNVNLAQSQISLIPYIFFNTDIYLNINNEELEYLLNLLNIVYYIDNQIFMDIVSKK